MQKIHRNLEKEHFTQIEIVTNNTIIPLDATTGVSVFKFDDSCKETFCSSSCSSTTFSFSVVSTGVIWKSAFLFLRSMLEWIGLIKIKEREPEGYVVWNYELSSFALYGTERRRRANPIPFSTQFRSTVTFCRFKFQIKEHFIVALEFWNNQKSTTLLFVITFLHK